LRIEDTDLERSERGYEESIFEDLRWLGLTWGEGPDTGGPHGPYRQSERVALYRDYANRLMEEGKAYRCYCSEDDLERKRDEARAKGLTPRYDGRCRNLSESEKRPREAEGAQAAIRFKMGAGSATVDDLIFGKVSFDCSALGDFIIIKSNGIATYNFAVVVDDALMKISHVIRGEGHLSNTPRQMLLAEALGFPVPRFAHHSLTMGSDGAPLSKRHGATSVSHYREEGFLPEAVVNYLALLGWAPEGGREIVGLAEMIDQFRIEKVSKSGAVFDIGKLKWMNSHYLKRRTLGEVTRLAVPFIEKAGFEVDGKDDGWIAMVVESVLDYLDNLSQIGGHVGIFFLSPPPLEEGARRILEGEKALDVVRAFGEAFKEVDLSSREHYASAVRKVKEKVGVSGKKLFVPLRASLTGKDHGPELDRVVAILGKDECLKRIENVLEHVVA
jgi:nondiscriminating glutamyl-tRNA synthetase